MIYPSQFPLNIDNVYEKEVYSCLHQFAHNSEDYDVFFSRKFSGVSKGEKIDYEVDFLIADVRNYKLNGLIVIEVKGNQLIFDGLKMEWIQDRRVMKTSPTTQARKNMGSLLQRFPSIANTTAVGWGVWFPRMINPGEGYLPTELADYQYFDKISLSKPGEKIITYFKQLKEQWSSKRGAHIDQYNNFKETLIRNLGYALPLHKKIEASEVRFLELTNKQLELLKLVSSNNDVLVKGPAGSGKTIMATTIAKELAEKNKSVLLLTFNRALANNIRYGLGKPENPEVATYHSIARRIIDDNFEGWWHENSKNEDFWELDIAIKLLDVENSKLPKYDFIIIDEAQDLREEWFETIESLIKPEGGFYVFMDEDQDIFGAYKKIGLSRNLFEFPLTENCRNTVQIIDYMKEFVSRKIGYPSDAAKGDAVKLIQYSNDTDQMNKIKHEWIRLVEEEGLRPDQIVLMMNAHKRASCLNNVKKFGKYKIQAVDRSGRLNNRSVNYTSINTFKGLEADVVMIIDTDKPEEPNNIVLYTQASRAKHVLYVFKKEN